MKKGVLARQRLRRLRALRDICAKIAPRELDMAAWHCGTRSCAMGHAAVTPEFIRDGWALGCVDKERGRGALYYKGALAWAEDLKRYFGLTEEETNRLFYPVMWAEPHAGAKAKKLLMDRLDAAIAKAEQRVRG